MPSPTKKKFTRFLCHGFSSQSFVRLQYVYRRIQIPKMKMLFSHSSYVSNLRIKIKIMKEIVSFRKINVAPCCSPISFSYLCLWMKLHNFLLGEG